MFHRASVALAFVLAIVSPSAFAEPRTFEFTGSVGAQGWEAAHDVGAFRPSTEGLVVPITGKDAYIISPMGDYRMPGTTLLTATLKSPAAGWGQVYFYKSGASEEQSLHFQVREGWNEVALPLLPLGEGWRLRLDFPATSGESVLARLALEPAGTRGVLSVRPSAKELTLQIQAPGPVEIVELLPHQELSDQGTAPVVGRGDAQAPVTVSRFDGQRDRLYSSFVARAADTHRTLGALRYVEIEGELARDARPFPTPSSKKGLQVHDIPDALALGIKHAAVNMSYGLLFDPDKKPGSPTWTIDGQTFSFNRSYLESLPVKKLSDAGVNVYLIFCAYEMRRPELDRALLNPNHAVPLPNHMAAFNTTTEEGTRTLRAAAEFLTDWFCRAGDEHGRMAGIIVGNEVNAHWQWYNLGSPKPSEMVADYERALRIVHTAVRSISAHARIYISLEHHWTLKPSARELPGKFVLEHLARLARTGGDYDWQVAFHPYPENLFQPRFWNDKTAGADFSTGRITFKNIELLPQWLARPEMQYHDRLRTAILSEEGFHSDNTPEGDTAQAAAYCLAWEKVTRLPGIEAFILHRHIDHRGEGGLNLGLWRRKPDSVATPDTKRPIYECFQTAGTPAQEKMFQFALPIVGLKSWDEANPIHVAP